MKSLKYITLSLLVVAMAALFIGAKSTPHRDDTFCATGGMAVVAADADITYPAYALFPRGFMVGNAGTVKVTLYDGTALSFASGELVTGIVYPLSVTRVWSTGSTATTFKVFW